MPISIECIESGRFNAYQIRKISGVKIANNDDALRQATTNTMLPYGMTISDQEDFERNNAQWKYTGKAKAYQHNNNGTNMARAGNAAAMLPGGTSSDQSEATSIVLKDLMLFRTRGANAVSLTFDYKWPSAGSENAGFVMESRILHSIFRPRKVKSIHEASLDLRHHLPNHRH